MAQELEGFASDERLTDEEVEAIVKRYGEQQTGGAGGPTVADVAEALQVDEQTVARLLRDIRGSESERQLQDRLNALEKENESLRSMAEGGYEGTLFSAGHWGRYRTRRRRRLGILAAIGIGAFLSFGSRTFALGFGSMRIVVILLLAGAVVFALRRLRE